jgi:hypothetical protein
MIPIRLIIYAAAAAVAIVGAAAYVRHSIDKGGYNRAMAEVEAAAQKDRDLKEADLAGVGIAFAAEAQKERIVERKIYEQVPVYVPVTDPLLSGGFRMLHDSAATGIPLDGTGRINAAAVSSADTARTIATNYADCRYEKQRVVSLQEVVNILNGGKNDPTRTNSGTAAADGADQDRTTPAHAGF